MCNDKGAVKLWLLSTVLNKIISLLSLFSGNCVSPHPSGMSWFIHGIELCSNVSKELWLHEHSSLPCLTYHRVFSLSEEL